MSDIITDVAGLEACVGKVPGPLDLKVIDYLDDHALRWISASPLMFAAFGGSGEHAGIDVTIGGEAPGFVVAGDIRSLRLPVSSLDDPGLAREGLGFGSLFLVPGLRETLRVNGRVRAVAGDRIEIAVEECYLHCAKALIRSGFWEALPRTEVPADDRGFLDASRFMALATIDAQGRADLSPKGDPAGAMALLRDGEAWYADRPGNRRIDSFRNIVTQPKVAAMALIPGSVRVMSLTGTARITNDAALRNTFTVADRTPKLVTRIEGLRSRIRDSAALERVRPWPAVRTAEGLDPAEIFKAHVKLSKAGGLQAALARATLSIPGLMEKGLEHDYRKNLY